MTDIDPVILEGLREHCAQIGNSSSATVAEYLSTDDAAIVQTYRAHLAPKPTKRQKAAAAVAEEPTSYHLRGENNVLAALEVVTVKGGKVILRIPVPTDFVRITLHGEETVVDMEVVKKLSEAEVASRYGVTSEVMHLLAAAARPK